VNGLKIEKRDNWVTYLREQCKNTSSEHYNKKKQNKIKKKIKKVIAGEEIQTDVMQPITNIIIYLSKQWKKLRSKDYLTTQSYFD
jgi:serine protease inhibitor